MRQPGSKRGMARALAAAGRFRRRHRTLINVVGSLVAAAVLVAILAGRRDEFVTALDSASLGVLALATALQVVALLSRSEAWHRCVEAAGGNVPRRVLYRASSMGYISSLVSAQVGAAARIAALRVSSPRESPGVATLVAAELPILAVEAVLAAFASFTLVGPLGLPWWLPIACFAVAAALSAGLRHLAVRAGRKLWQGLAVLLTVRGGALLTGLVLIAVFAQISRNWLLLHAVGVDATIFEATAVLIAMVILIQLPVGPTSGAAAAVLILGSSGVAAVAAAGVLTTVTGTLGGLAFVAWAALDRFRHGSARQVERRSHPAPTAPGSAPASAGSRAASASLSASRHRPSA